MLAARIVSIIGRKIIARTDFMATAVLTNSEPRIIPLAETSADDLAPLFEEQCREWLSVFRWDYSAPSRMIRDVLSEGDLLGFAASIDGRYAGMGFYVVEGNRVSIGDIYISNEWRGMGVDCRIVEAMIEEIDRLTRIRRIESQCVHTGNEGAGEMFQSLGFHACDRRFMMLRIKDEAEVGPSLPHIEMRSWEEDDFDEAARVIHLSYRGSLDARINSQYASEEGCAETLSILTGHVWCGDFLPEVTRVAVNKDTGQMVSVLIASRIAEGAGHISQISVRPTFQGLGAGRRMIESAMAEFSRRGIKYVSLVVTDGNRRAVHLYQSCGFQTIHTFQVFYRERRRRRN
ncbi:MAG: GNAT family N-acetyltransferase [Acidobacteriota bacterium]